MRNFAVMKRNFPIKTFQLHYSGVVLESILIKSNIGMANRSGSMSGLF